MKQIFLIGTHGAGKTTAFELLKERHKDWGFIDEYIKESLSKGAKINSDQTYKDFKKIYDIATEYYYRGVFFSKMKPIAVFDRSLIDSVIYALRGKIIVDPAYKRESLEVLKEGVVFLFRADKRKLTNSNPNRWIDFESQKQIDDLFVEILNKCKINFFEIPIDSSKEEVVEFIERSINWK